MIIDDKGRLLGKLSVIDLFALVMLIMIVTVAYFKIGNSSKAAVRQPEQLVRVTFYKEALEDFTASAIETGTPALNDTNKTFMGTIVEVNLGESVNYFPDIDGQERAAPMEGYSSVEIITEVTGRISEGALLLNGNLYGSGSKIIIWAGKAKIQLTISDVQAV